MLIPISLQSPPYSAKPTVLRRLLAPFLARPVLTGLALFFIALLAVKHVEHIWYTKGLFASWRMLSISPISKRPPPHTSSPP